MEGGCGAAVRGEDDDVSDEQDDEEGEEDGTPRSPRSPKRLKRPRLGATERDLDVVARDGGDHDDALPERVVSGPVPPPPTTSDPEEDDDAEDNEEDEEEEEEGRGESPDYGPMPLPLIAYERQRRNLLTRRMQALAPGQRRRRRAGIAGITGICGRSNARALGTEAIAPALALAGGGTTPRLSGPQTVLVLGADGEPVIEASNAALVGLQTGVATTLNPATTASMASASIWTKDRLPPPMEHEIEFCISNPRSYKQGKSILSPILTMQGGAFRFRVLCFPMGTETTQKPEQLAAFVEALPPEGNQEPRWAFESVKYQISVVHWKDYRRTATQADTYTFRWDSADRGWHRGFVKAVDMTPELGWVNEEDQLCIRASCSVRRAMLHVPAAAALVGGCRRTQVGSSGYVGLKNHGATCYMNCLLQTLFHIGRFREIVYSIDNPEQEHSVQAASAVVSEDEVVNDVVGASFGEDDRPALPLLVALQNLFYRLQTSEIPVSCRELMRSFGWDTADAFMQHDAQELNRLLCDRLEEQMKGTLMDGEIKRLFEGEMENYIDCMDVDYRSTRSETFYDLQLNVRNEMGKDLTSLEESLRDFTSEEILDRDNLYDAGIHGKQRARKGIKFKRFPPLLYIQLKRFMFDVERMDMCKINGRLKFPLVLDLEALAPGSGKYALHTVVVHSGGVSSGHYYAFVRVRDRETGKSRWVKFDDEQVTPCSEQAAVEDNYGGEDAMIWNYFALSPRQLAEKTVPKAQRIHNAYMLSYVRADLLDKVLSPPDLDNGNDQYRRLAERCAREARLAEERRRMRVEQLMRVEVRLLMERDLIRLEGFWSHNTLPYTHKLRMSRDQLGEDLWREVEALTNVPHNHLALFFLHTRKTRQSRFKFLPPNQVLRTHLAPHGAPANSNSGEPPHLSVLCVASRGYDPQTLALQPSLPELPHEIIQWSDDVCLLIVKYFCPTMVRLVTLGCYYCGTQEHLECMLTGKWLEQRLKPFVDRKEVAPLPSDAYRDGNMLCWEEYCYKTPKDIMERNLRASVEKEGLFSGDIVIWQPSSQFLAVSSSLSDRDQAHSAAGGATVSSDDFEDDLSASMRVRTPRDLAMRLASQVPVLVRLHRPDSPWCPEGVAADGVWAQRHEAVPLPTDVANGATIGVDDLSPADCGLRDQEFVADMRWRMPTFASRVAKALDVVPSLRAGDTMWLFAHCAPSAADVAPVYRLEASRGGGRGIRVDAVVAGVANGQQEARVRQRTLGDLLPRSSSVPSPLRLSFHAVVVPRGIGTGPRRIVVVHFFTAAVREAGACIFHVPVQEAEDAGDGPEEDDAGSDSDARLACSTGRPAFDAAEMLQWARRHLELPANRELLEQLAPPAAQVANGAGRVGVHFPLRLLDVSSGRIRAVHRCRDPSGNGGGSDANSSELSLAGPTAPRLGSLWPSKGRNVFASALRVEADWDCDAEPSDRRPEPPAPGTPPLEGADERPQKLRRGSAHEDVSAVTTEVGAQGDDATGEARPHPPSSRVLRQHSADGAAQMVEVYHTEPSGHAFGHPFLLRVAMGECAKSVAVRVQAKLGVPQGELKRWRLLFADGDLRAALDEADEWPMGRSDLSRRGVPQALSATWSPSSPAFCLERPHPATPRSRSPTSARALRAHKPLTIRGGAR